MKRDEVKLIRVTLFEKQPPFNWPGIGRLESMWTKTWEHYFEEASEVERVKEAANIMGRLGATVFLEIEEL